MMSASLHPLIVASNTRAARSSSPTASVDRRRQHAASQHVSVAWVAALLIAANAAGCGSESTGTAGSGTSGADTTTSDVTASDSVDDATTPSDTAGGSDTVTVGDTSTAEDSATAADSNAADTTSQDTDASDTTGQDTDTSDTTGQDTNASDTTGQDTNASDTTGQDPTTACQPTTPSTEICDGIDNDCDGTTDAQVVCGNGEPCVTWSCAGVAGCKQAPAANGTACDDGDPCSKDDACGQIEGTSMCKPGANACDDGNACTSDACVNESGKATCSHQPVDDASATTCTTPDICQKGTCTGGACVASSKCVDNNPCTQDSCNKITGACSYQPFKTNTPCSLGQCEIGLMCNELLKQCVVKGPTYKALDCDDKDACTTDSCDAIKGCTHATIADGGACNDGDLCTKTDTCKAGSCSGTALCDDGDACTVDVCDGAKQSCSINPVAGCTACAGVGDCAAISSCALVSCASGLCTYENKPGCADVVVTEVRTEPTNPTVGANAFKTIVKWNTTNFGTKALTAPFSHLIMFSQNEVWGDAGDFNITGGCTAIGPQNYLKPEPGQTIAMTMSCLLPAKASGTYYLLVRANNVQGEDDSTNNTTAGKVEVTYVEQANIKAITFLPKDKPNFTAGANEKLTMELSAQNNGNAASPQIPFTMFWASTNKDPWNNKLKVGQNGSLPAMEPGAPPQTIGLYVQFTYGSKGNVYTCAYIDPNNTVKEWSEGDNIVCVSMIYN